jgi:hypothetical protein
MDKARRCVSALVFAVLSVLLAGAAAADDPPEGVKQVLPRGGIPAIFDPHFVPAASAKIPDGAWVFGVVIDGQAKAYDLNLLNHHEIVNDVVGGKPVAPTW